MLVAIHFLTLFVSCLAIHDKYIDNVESYSGYRVYSVFVSQKEDAFYLRSLEQEREEYEFWSDITPGSNVTIMVPGEFVPKLEADLEGFKSSVAIPDLQVLVNQERQSMMSYQSLGSGSMDWNGYYGYDEIVAWGEALAAKHDFVSTESIGKSYEKREMRVIKVCKGGKCGKKPAMYIDAGIHAREWISTAVLTYMLNELVENDAAHPELTEKLDWYFLPVANPDGYEYTRSAESHRFWRKTRSSYHSPMGCKGVDANRNWGYGWASGGSSHEKCKDTYHGPERFSEIENKNVRNFLRHYNLKKQIKFFNALHNFSQLILTPWGFTEVLPEDYDKLLSMAEAGNEALFAKHGKRYKVGCVPCIFYIASGSSMDYTHGEMKIPYTYTIELRDTGVQGFIIPPEEIVPTGEEIWAFHQVAAKKIIEEFAS